VFEAQYFYGPSVARRACLERMWYERSGIIIGAVIVLAVVIPGMFSPAFQIPCVFIAGLLCFPCLLMAWEFAVAGDGQAEGTVVVRGDDEGVTVSSGHGQSSAPWSSYSKSYLTHTFLFLDRYRGDPFFLPRTAVSADAIEFAQARIQAAGRRCDIGVPQA
jgi:hypothetical protein